jgi:hypothetical protein
MTTRHYSRLWIGSVILVLIVGLLIITGSTISSAAMPDRTAPTTPTNLAAGSVTETTIGLSWNASTDNSGKWSYKVRITDLRNSLDSIATVSQSQTTYTAKALSPNTSYRFVVYAVDGSGNKSADSNVVNASTPARTTSTSPPPSLQAIVLGPSQVQLTWTESADYGVANRCCSYGINMNGSRITQHVNWAAAPAGSLSVIIRHLTRSTTHNFSISVFDWSGTNISTSNIASATTEASNDFTPPSPPTNLHLVRDDSCGELWLGWIEATDETDSQGFIEYEIYVNGVLSPMPVSGGIDVDFVYATAHGDNYFQVKAVDRAGNTSSPSNMLKLYQWPC